MPVIADSSKSVSIERAVALHRAANLNEAADMYETLLRAEPANADLWGLLSIVQMQLDKHKEAMRNWRKCVSLDEANASMSLHMREKEDPPEALLAMRKAYRRLFENPDARLQP